MDRGDLRARISDRDHFAERGAGRPLPHRAKAREGPYARPTWKTVENRRAAQPLGGALTSLPPPPATGAGDSKTVARLQAQGAFARLLRPDRLAADLIGTSSS